MNGSIEMPRPIRNLPRNTAGYPVPWFVAWIDGKPDFRVIGSSKIENAVMGRLCWLCGQRLGASDQAFVIGPMCAVNRVSSEPPSHHSCAVYAAKACPFLANPNKQRRETHLPDASVDPAGIAIKRNPGVALVWSSKDWRPFKAPGGVLFDVGRPITTEWFAHGRAATRDEILASIQSVARRSAQLPRTKALMPSPISSRCWQAPWI